MILGRVPDAIITLPQIIAIPLPKIYKHLSNPIFCTYTLGFAPYI
jgi:hypothetical protein